MRDVINENITKSQNFKSFSMEIPLKMLKVLIKSWRCA